MHDAVPSPQSACLGPNTFARHDRVLCRQRNVSIPSGGTGTADHTHHHARLLQVDTSDATRRGAKNNAYAPPAAARSVFVASSSARLIKNTKRWHTILAHVSTSSCSSVFVIIIFRDVSWYVILAYIDDLSYRVRTAPGTAGCTTRRRATGSFFSSGDSREETLPYLLVYVFAFVICGAAWPADLFGPVDCTRKPLRRTDAAFMPPRLRYRAGYTDAQVYGDLAPAVKEARYVMTEA